MELGDGDVDLFVVWAAADGSVRHAGLGEVGFDSADGEFHC